jgi:hypothetical protein
MTQSEIKTAIFHLRMILKVQTFIRTMLVLWVLFGMWGIYTDYFTSSIAKNTDPMMKEISPWVLSVLFIGYLCLLLVLKGIRPNRELVSNYSNLVNELAKLADHIMYLRDTIAEQYGRDNENYRSADGMANAINALVSSNTISLSRNSLRPRSGWRRKPILKVVEFSESYLIGYDANEVFETTNEIPA